MYIYCESIGVLGMTYNTIASVSISFRGFFSLHLDQKLFLRSTRAAPFSVYFVHR
jgi:hypothetical protein